VTLTGTTVASRPHRSARRNW